MLCHGRRCIRRRIRLGRPDILRRAAGFVPAESVEGADDSSGVPAGLEVHHPLHDYILLLHGRQYLVSIYIFHPVDRIQ